MKTRLLLLIFIIFSLNAISQTDTEFWFAAPEVSSNNYNFDIPIVFRISTSNQASTVTLSQPANPSFSPITVNIAANSTATIDVSTFLDMVECKPANTVLNYGIYITASQPVTAYYEIISTQCGGCNPEIYALKGKNSLGTYFLIPSQTNYSNSPNYNPLPFSSFIIVATENNTSLTITPSNNIVGHQANVPFTINLNKGQTYSATATSQLANLHLQGSVVNSNKPVAITYSDDLLIGPSGCADLAGDQIVPVNMVGMEYIVVKGGLYIERVSVLGTQNNTGIYINGNSTPAATIGLGQTYEFTLTDPSAYIKASNPVYVLHTSGNGCEIGAALLPSIICTGSQQIGFARTSSVPFYLNLVVLTTSVGFFELNGNTSYITPSMFSIVPGTSGLWSFAHILFNTTQIPIDQASLIRLTNGDVFQMGIINGDVGGGCSYGYFSKFNSLAANAGPDQFICLGKSANLNASGGSNYVWSSSGTLSKLNISNPIATPLETTTYIVTISNNFGCSMTDSVIVTVISSPVATASGNSVCSGQTIRLIAEGGTGYNWSGPDNFSSTTKETVIENASIASTGKYTVIVTGNNDCSDTASVIVTVNPMPDVSVFPNPAIICSGNSVSLAASGATTYLWSPDKGLSSSTGANIIASPEESTTYTVIGANPGCSDSITVSIEVKPLPIASFIIEPEAVSIYNSFVNFYDKSIGTPPPNRWHWTLGNGDTSNISNFNYKYRQSGNYRVTLMVYNEFGCSGYYFKDISVQFDHSVYIPNAFNPDDLVNNTFLVYGKGLFEFNLKIFNRWGMMLFESDNISKGWDGKFNGNNQPQGVYIYRLFFKDASDKKHNMFGTITLLK